MSRSILAVVLVAFSLQSATAAIFERDNRFAANPSVDPAVRAIAQAYFRSRRATAFLIDRCHAATSQHLVSMTADPVGARVSLRLFDAERRLGSTVVDAGHLERRSKSVGYLRDWALLRLDDCLPKGTPTFGLALRPSEGIVATAGYPSDLSGAASEWNCRIRAISARGLLHDCASYPGASGSPLFIRNAEGVPVAVAIQAGARRARSPEPFRLDLANVATPVAPLVGALIRDNVLMADVSKRGLDDHFQSVDAYGSATFDDGSRD
jgi:hypothetical protein